MARPPSSRDNALFEQLERTLRAETSQPDALNNLVAQAPFAHEREMGLLFLGFISFFLLDGSGRTVICCGVTDNDYYHHSVEGYNFQMSDYRVPMSAKSNSVVKAISSGRPVASTDWDTFRRPKVKKGPARLNQANSGIGYSVVYPLTGRAKGAMMFNFFQYPEFIGEPQESFMRRYTDIVSGVLGEVATVQAVA